MRSIDFFREKQDPEWELKSLDPWVVRKVFDVEMVERLRTNSDPKWVRLEVHRGVRY
jgi:hypothetical protein